MPRARPARERGGTENPGDDRRSGRGERGRCRRRSRRRPCSSSPRTGDGSGSVNTLSATDSVAVTVGQVHLSVDSQNTLGLSPPDHSAGEEAIKDDPALPGKLIKINSDDKNHDHIAAYVDGYNLDSLPAAQAAGVRDTPRDDQIQPVPDTGFVPIVVTLPTGVDPTQARLQFAYSQSDPSQATIDAAGHRAGARRPADLDGGRDDRARPARRERSDAYGQLRLVGVRPVTRGQDYSQFWQRPPSQIPWSMPTWEGPDWPSRGP